MGIWIAMLISVLLVPAGMLGAGKWLRDTPPKDVNRLFGYRTRRSMKNQDTWDFAHRYAGSIWLKWGFIMLTATLTAFFPTLGKSEDIISVTGLVLLALQTIVLVLSILPTERALKRTFTDEGERRNP